MEKIKPIFTENSVAVCFSANDKYIPLLSVEIQSLIENSTKDTNYDLVVFTTGISDENQFLLLSQIVRYSNVSLRFINVCPHIYGYNFYIDSDITNTKYSSEIYFRVLAPALMPDYEKIIFLDADLVINTDIKELYNIDVSNVLIGAVRDYEGIANCYNNNYERTRYRINDLGITKFDNYFSSGVIVMNVQKFNENFTEKQLLDLAVSRKWKQYDQDLLNFICKDSLKIIDSTFNFMEDNENIYKSMPQALFEEYLNSEINPKIIHFAGRRKPWIDIESPYSKYFWKYAEQTKYFTHLKNLKDF